MVKLTVINGTPAPSIGRERVYSSLRKTQQKGIYQCPHCASRTHLTVDTMGYKQKVCVFCLMNEKRLVEMRK